MRHLRHEASSTYNAVRRRRLHLASDTFYASLGSAPS